MLSYAIAIFLGAFLLFLIQPMLGRQILPWFGGTPAVWTACLLFFQALLLAGYAYAHSLAGKRNLRRQVLIHMALLLAAFIWLPVIPSSGWKPTGADFPLWRILALLLAAVGGPYLVLSSTSPLLQAWFARTRPGKSPYWLYSVSNLGSLLALAAYPLLLEPNLPLTTQSRIWSWLYAAFALASAFAVIAAIRWQEAPEEATEPAEVERPPGWQARTLWLLLAACGTTMLLATTNQLCLDVAVIPLLWILPLGLYLITFIICFHGSFLYSRIGFGILLAGMFVQAVLVLQKSVFVDLRLQIASYSFTLFVCCMVCHGELVRSKPAARYLTEFYLLIAAGGVLGGLFVAMAAPRVFSGYWEFHLGLVLTAVLFLVSLFRDPKTPLHRGKPLWAWSFFYLAVAALAVALALHARGTLEYSRETVRNFYGILRVLDYDRDKPGEHRLTLMNGRIEHGFQYLAAEKQHWPTSYFGPDSGIGMAIRFHPNRQFDPAGPKQFRIGVLGLGTGTLATYGNPGDIVRFYEINPEVVRLSNRYFTYIKSSPAHVEIQLGDGRISLERERQRGSSQQFDVLAVDAFTGDAIPIHLLTRECYEIYRYHLKPDGILAVHISNRYFDLAPVGRGLAALGSAQGMKAIWIENTGNEFQGTDSTDWILITANREFLENEDVTSAASEWPADGRPAVLWTDDFSNLLKLYRPR